MNKQKIGILMFAIAAAFTVAGDGFGRYMKNGGYVNGTDAPLANCGVENGTAIVGSYSPNSFGLYDTAGNVWEWCLDKYVDDITSLNGSVHLATGWTRTIRGGDWHNAAGSCRPAIRSGGNPSERLSNFGFRVCCMAGLK